MSDETKSSLIIAKYFDIVLYYQQDCCSSPFLPILFAVLSIPVCWMEKLTASAQACMMLFVLDGCIVQHPV